MVDFFLRRLVDSVVMLLALTVVTFALSRAATDPVALMLSELATEQEEADLRARLGLDRPLVVQYGKFVARVLQGDLGLSYRNNIPVRHLIRDTLPNSILLGALAMLLAVVLAVPFGITAAVNKGLWVDRAATVLAVILQAAPSFWVAMLLIDLVSVRARLLPISGERALGPHMILPAFTLAGFVMVGMMRLLRSSMLEALDSEYVKLLRIKGLSETLVVWKHALRNASLPLLSFGGMYVALLVTQAIIVEAVFGYPGIGRLGYQAVMTGDFNVIQAVVLVTGLLVLSTNLLVDLISAIVDPRIRVG